MKDLNFEKIETVNSVPLYVMHLPHANTVAAGVLVKAGTREENWPTEAGLAHALEHMLLQGTKRFPTSKDVHEYIEEIGGDQNAWTSHEGTFFHARVPAEHKIRAYEFISEVVLNPLLPEAKIRTEMQNIVEEIRMHNDNPVSFLVEQVGKPFLYGEHPAARNITGSEKSVSSFQREQFVNFRKKFYHSGNYVFVAVGQITVSEAQGLFEQYFPEKAEPQAGRQAIKLVDSGKRRIVFKKELKQVNLMLMAPVDLSDKKTERALSLFATMIGGGASCPLFQEVRDKRGLCYSIQVFLEELSDIGFFGVYIGTDPQRYQEAIDVTRDILAKYKTDTALLEKAKNMRLGSLDLAFEHTGGILGMAASDILEQGKPKGYKELKEEIMDIQIKDVISAVDAFLKPADIREALLVPQEPGYKAKLIN